MGGGRDTLKVIFFGTPDYVIPVLEALYKYHKLVAVVTQPAKLAGRKQLMTYSAVDNWAHKRNIKVITNLSDKLPEANLGIVASYGKIIPEKVIRHFPSGILNIHPSLLPKYRGASPIQFQIMDGQTQTGVTIIKMDKLMDHGPIVSQLKDEITQEDTNESLRNRLFERSAEFLINLIPNYLNQKIRLKEQNHADATFTKTISKETGFVDLKKDKPEEIERKMRALEPWPGIWTKVLVDGGMKRLRILGLHLNEGEIELDKVQLEGKKSVEFEEFKRGYPQIEI